MRTIPKPAKNSDKVIESPGSARLNKIPLRAGHTPKNQQHRMAWNKNSNKISFLFSSISSVLLIVGNSSLSDPFVLSLVNVEV